MKFAMRNLLLRHAQLLFFINRAEYADFYWRNTARSVPCTSEVVQGTLSFIASFYLRRSANAKTWRINRRSQKGTINQSREKDCMLGVVHNFLPHFQRVAAAFFAISDRCVAVVLFILAFAPAFPLRIRPDIGMSGSISPVAILATIIAHPMASAGRR
jgi:hypothetical protein